MIGLVFIRIGVSTPTGCRLSGFERIHIIQGVFQSQEGLPILEDPRLVLSIQVVEANMDPGSGFGAFMESEQREMVPMIHGFNTYV